MARQRGFRWALLCSAMIHIIVFLTVPMGGSVGRARDTVVRTVRQTAVEFVTFVKPPAPARKPPQTRAQPRPRVVRRVVRRVRHRVRRPLPAPAPTTLAEPREPQQPPELALLPPEPVEQQATPAPVPEPEPVIIHPTPPPVASAAETPLQYRPPAPEAPPTPDSSPDMPKAAPAMAAAAPVPAMAPTVPEPGPVVPAPTTVVSAGSGGGQAPGPRTPGDTTIAFAPSPLTADPGPGADVALPGAGSTKAAPAMGSLPAGPVQTTDNPRGDLPQGTSGEGSGPVLTATAAPPTARAAPGSPGGGGRTEIIAFAGREAPGAAASTRAPSGKAQPNRRPAVPGRGVGSAGNGVDAGEGTGPGGGRPVLLATNPQGETVVATGPAGRLGTGGGGDDAGLGFGEFDSPASGSGFAAGIVIVKAAPAMGGRGDGSWVPMGGIASQGQRGGVAGEGEGGGGPVLVGGGAAGYGAGGPVLTGGPSIPGAPGASPVLVTEGSGGSGTGGSGWYGSGVKSSPTSGWLVAVLPPAAGGQAAGGGAGFGQGGGLGDTIGPGVGPVGPVAVGWGGEGASLPALVATAVGRYAPGALSALLGIGEGPGTGMGGVGAGAGKMSPMMVAGAGPLVVVGVGDGGGPGLGRVSGDLPGPGGPVGLGLPSVGGGGGLGLLPLPEVGGGVVIGGLTGGGPGGGLGGVASAGDAKSAPGGLYVGVSGTFDMPMGVTASDYNTDAEGMRNLLAEVRARTNVRVTALERFVPLTLENIRDTPIIHLRGHRPFSFTEEEREVLRQYVAQGGTIFGEDSHGPFAECFRREMKKIFGVAPSDLPINHDLYRAHYVLDRVPGGDMGERYPLQGIQVGNRLGVIFSRNDYGDCWEGTGGWVRPESREPAFKMGVNIFTYVVANWNQNRR